MVTAMEWERVERVDWGDAAADVSGALWRVPADGMEQELDLREDDAFEHVVPLARATVHVLRAIRPLTGRGPLPFCRAGNRNEPISENAIGYLYNRRAGRTGTFRTDRTARSAR